MRDSSRLPGSGFDACVILFSARTIYRQHLRRQLLRMYRININGAILVLFRNGYMSARLVIFPADEKCLLYFRLCAVSMNGTINFMDTVKLNGMAMTTGYK